MKKLFLTSGLVLCMACPAMAATDIAVTDQNTTSATCTNTYLDSYEGPVSFEAKWTADSYAVNYAPGVAQNTTNGVANHTHIPQGSMTAGTVTYDDGLTPAANGFTTPTGYEFTGWNGAKLDGTSGTQDYAAGTTYTPYKIAGPITLTAQWAPKSYTIIYDHGTAGARTTGFSGSMTNETVTYDEDKTLTANAYSIDGYTFTGWSGDYDNETGDEHATAYLDQASLSPYHIDHSLRLTAQWTPEKYSITYKPGKAGARTVQGSDVVKEVYYDATVYADRSELKTLVANTFSIAGYDFDKWVSDKNVTEGSDATITGQNTSNISSTVEYSANTTISPYHVVGGTAMVARWTPHTYTISYAKGTPGSHDSSYVGGATSDTSATYDDTNVALAQNGYTATGYHFVGWKSDYKLDDNTQPQGGQIYGTTGTGNTDWTVPTVSTYVHPDNITLTAQWAKNSYQITFSCGDIPSGASTQTVRTNQPRGAIDVTYDTAYAAITDAPKTECDIEGYHFNGWSCTNSITSAGGTYTVDGNTVCTATWEKNVIDLHWYGANGNNNTEITLPANSEAANCTYDEGITLPAQPSKTGYSFNGWKVKQTVQAAPVGD